MKILVTGTAGFIGYYTARRLLERGDEVVGLDSINDYYERRLKYGRLAETGVQKEDISYGLLTESRSTPAYRFVQLDLTDREGLLGLFESEGFDAVVHLAAQAGVRYSLENPHAYAESNISGFLNILEGCRAASSSAGGRGSDGAGGENGRAWGQAAGLRHLVYASSSSVYGLNEQMPFTTSDNVDHPVSLYAASKKAGELMAHTYSHLYGIPTTGLRFFTVYGPWGRPDMAPILFASAITEGRPIKVFNHGEMQRDFTYVEDIVEGVVRVLDRPPEGNPSWSGAEPDPSSSPAPYRIYNIGKGRPVALMDFIRTLEEKLGIEAQKEYLPMQPGDVPATWADTSDLERDFGYRPTTELEEGIEEFVAWYKDFYKI